MYECIVLCCLFDCRFGKITEWGPGGETVEVQESVNFQFLIYFHFTPPPPISQSTGAQ